MHLKSKSFYIWKCLLAGFLSVLGISDLNGQESQLFLAPDISIEGKTHYGFIISHHKSMMHLANTHLSAFEMNVHKQTHGEKSWHQLYKYPQIGLCLWYSSLGNSEILGSAYSIFPYMDFPLITSKKTALYFRFGSGLGYMTKRFDRFEDYKNIAIGSHVNATLNMLYHLKYELSSRLTLSAGVGLTHFSNGAVKMPNLGINIPTINLGLAYKINKEVVRENLKKEHEKSKKKNEFSIISGFGSRQIYPVCSRSYFAATLSGLYSRVISPKRKFGLGLDFSYCGANLTILGNDSIYPKSKLFVTRPGISISQELVFSKMIFIMQVGIYVYAMDKSDGMYYDRFGIRYMITPHLMANLCLKTHFAKADYIECGLGYKF